MDCQGDGIVGTMLPSIHSMSEKEATSDRPHPDYETLSLINLQLKINGYIYIFVQEGDYRGSIVKFVGEPKELITRTYKGSYNVHAFFSGRLKFSQNNRLGPEFLVKAGSCLCRYLVGPPTTSVSA